MRKRATVDSTSLIVVGRVSNGRGRTRDIGYRFDTGYERLEIIAVHASAEGICRAKRG